MPKHMLVWTLSTFRFRLLLSLDRKITCHIALKHAYVMVIEGLKKSWSEDMEKKLGFAQRFADYAQHDRPREDPCQEVFRRQRLQE